MFNQVMIAGWTAERRVAAGILNPSKYAWDLRTTLCIAITALVAGCSASAARGDLAGINRPQLSAQQCAAQADIENAALNAAAADSAYIIQPGDDLVISFYLNSEFNDSVVVRPDGQINLQLVGDVRAAGLTPQALAARLNEAYSSELRSPDASVHVKNMPSRQVYVEGEVSKPKAIVLEPGMTLLQAIADAGGLTDNASSDAVVIRRDACGTPQGSVVNLSQAMEQPSSGEDVALLPRDIVVVPRSTIANINLFIKHYIRNNLPIQPYASFPL
jgi:protein involved in polysaccharide export with SLBB domain